MGSRFGLPGPHFLAVGVRAVPYSELGRNFVAHFARLGAHCGSPGRHFWLSDPKPRRHRLELGPHVDQMEQHVHTFPGFRLFWLPVLDQGFGRNAFYCFKGNAH